MIGRKEGLECTGAHMQFQIIEMVAVQVQVA